MLFASAILVPFYLGLAFTMFRIIVNLNLSVTLFTLFGSCCVSFDRFPIFILLLATLLEWLTEILVSEFRLRSESVYNYVCFAALINLYTSSSNIRLCNVLITYILIKAFSVSINLLFGYRWLNTIIHYCLKGAVVYLFCLALIPDSYLIELLFTRPKLL